jgi:polysaccharide deacetylase 2 family uncharacterized protein YibQ
MENMKRFFLGHHRFIAPGAGLGSMNQSLTENPPKLSRRGFIFKTAAWTVGTFLGTHPLFRSFVRAFPISDEEGPESASHENPQIVLIIDDLGYNVSRVLPFLDLGIPMTFSILPRLRYSRRLAEKIHAAGHEVMLHQPMEPYKSSLDPGPGALYLSQNTKEMWRIIKKNVSSFPFAVGVNNHMGSRFTESRENITETLKVFRDKGFFFIDSFTSCHSIAFDTAKQLNMSTAFRDVFIDNRSERNYIYLQLLKLKKYALKYGYAIGIGHPRPETVSAVQQFIDELEGTRFSFTHASRILKT